MRYIPGVILAAGRGRRFGRRGSKMLAKLDGKPVLFHVLEEALRSRLNPVFVVLGYERGRIKSRLSGLFARALKEKRLRIVLNPAWSEGRASSRRAAIEALPKKAPAAVFLLGDMPFVTSRLIDRVADEACGTGRICCLVRRGNAGHPIAFPRPFFEGLRNLGGGESASRWVMSHRPKRIKIAASNGLSQRDIDTVAALRSKS